MAENWIPYMRSTEKGPQSCMIDTQHRASAADGSRPSLTIVHVTMKDPGEEGLGSHDEANRIDEAWDSVSDRLAGAGAAYVARLRANGRMSYCVYSPGSAREQVERLAREAFPGDEVRFERREDGPWEIYRRLLPTAAEERPALDAMVVQALEQHGDLLTPKRDVRHFAYFGLADGAQRFAELARGDGFKVEVSAPDAERPAFGVMASRDDSVSLEAITPVTIALCEHARACGGEYDGWEARLVQKRPGLLGRLFGRG